MIREGILLFFREKPRLLPLYEELESLIFSRLEGVQVRVRKTQVSFYQKRLLD